MPFLFVSLSIIYGCVLLYRHKKGLISYSDLIVQLLIGLTLLQSILHLLLLIFAVYLGYWVFYALHLASFFLLFSFNLGFAIYIDRRVPSQDGAFKHWAAHFSTRDAAYKAVCGILSFKGARLYYSNFTNVNAAFDDFYSFFYFPLFLVSMASFPIQVLPAFVADVWSVILVPWGYQIVIFSLENVILGIAIFILELLEYRY